MMAGHALVHAQHLHLKLGSHGRLMEVDVVPAGPGAVDRGPHVVGGRGIRRFLVGNRAHTIGCSGEFAKKLHQSRVEAFRHCLIALEQRFRCVVVELRVSAQEGVEGGDVAFELDLFNDRQHFAADARHFLKTDFVDFIGC